MKLFILSILAVVIFNNCSNKNYTIIRENYFSEKYFNLNKYDTNKVHPKEVYQKICKDFSTKTDSLLLFAIHGSNIIREEYALYDYRTNNFYYLDLAMTGSIKFESDTSKKGYLQIYRYEKKYSATSRSYLTIK